MHKPLRAKYAPMYIDMALAAERQTQALREQVGCVIVTPMGITIPGFNGQPAGWHTNHCENTPVMEPMGPAGCDILRMKTDRSVIHAENNAIGKATRAGVSLEGADLYVSVAPCDVCARQIIPSGIKRVFYGRVHDDMTGVETLLSAGVWTTPWNSKEEPCDFPNQDRGHRLPVPG